MHEQAIQIITDYMNEHLFEASATWSKREFEKRSYARWAVFEILQEIMDSPYRQPICVLEEFICKTAMYANFSEKEKRSRRFQIAVEVAEELIQLLD